MDKYNINAIKKLISSTGLLYVQEIFYVHFYVTSRYKRI